MSPEKVLDRIDSWGAAVSRRLAFISTAALIFVALMVCIEIIARSICCVWSAVMAALAMSEYRPILARFFRGIPFEPPLAGTTASTVFFLYVTKLDPLNRLLFLADY